MGEAEKGEEQEGETTIANISEAPPTVQESLHPKPDHILVYFFGDHNLEAKIQPFTKNHSERIQNVKIKNFKVALQESQIWVNSKGANPPTFTETPPHLAVEHPTEPVSAASPSPPPIQFIDNSPATTNPHTTTKVPTSTPITAIQYRSPSPPFVKIDHPPDPPDQGAVADIPLSAELAKVWDYVEVDEDTVDGFVVISSEKDMSPVVAFYNEHKRKLGLHAPQISPKRLKTDTTTFSFQLMKPQPRVDSQPSSTSGTVPHLHTTPTSIPYTHISTPQASQQAHSHFIPYTPPQQNTTSPPASQTLAPNVPIQRHTFTGAATNGFQALPLQGIVEGSEEGLHVEFAVNGHTYRGFLLARDSLPAVVSPLVPPMSAPYAGLSPYVNLARMTAVAVTKQHQERLVDLGRLVVASAMVPYAYPPPLHL